MNESIADVNDELLPSKKPSVPNQWTGWRLFWRLFLTLFIIMFVIIGSFFVRFLVLYSYHEVEGLSMVPTYNQHQTGADDEASDRVFARRKAKPKVGDVIIFKQTYDFNNNGNPVEKLLIKRVVAKAGDQVKVEKNGSDYRLLIHYQGDAAPTQMQGQDENLPGYESYVKDGYSVFQSMYDAFTAHTPVGFLTLGEGQYFVLGDNRDKSVDGTNFGPINKDQISGVVHFKVSAQWSGIKRAFNNFSIIFVLK